MCEPSGEYKGRDSVAGCETNSRASPPAVGTVQMSPPETTAISRPSGEMPGSAKEVTRSGSAGVSSEIESRIAWDRTVMGAVYGGASPEFPESIRTSGGTRAAS